MTNQSKTRAMNFSNLQQSLLTNQSNPLEIKKVKGKKALNEFIRLPWQLYKDDPMWVPPLLLERRLQLSPSNPFFAHALYCSWIAYRDKKPVGRISAQIDQLHLDRYQNATGFFGMLEAEDHPETFHILMNTAEGWLREQGMKRISGPFNLSINQELGLLVEGFGTPPSMMMGHAHPYYANRIEKGGYQKEKDLLAYIISSDLTPCVAMKIAIARTKNRVHTRSLRKSHFQQELKIIRDIFNDAWSQNWGFVPFTNKEFEHLGKDLKLLVDEELVKIAEVDGDPVAFIVTLPNINEAIQDLNGKLLPFGWVKLLWRLKVKYPSTARIPLMGVRSRYHDSLMGAALSFMMIGAIREAAHKRGIKSVELSWILEDNMGMRNIIESIGGQVYKTYRIYGKAL
jgi:hypothetical protein